MDRIISKPQNAFDKGRQISNLVLLQMNAWTAGLSPRFQVSCVNWIWRRRMIMLIGAFFSIY
jgi:hypothetical protein